MNEKELKINIPKGYEIDKENSTFELIKFKPIKADLTYNGIAVIVNSKESLLYIDEQGFIKENLSSIFYDCPNVATSERQLQKVLAINKLFNIAKYYNGDWKPNWDDKKETKYIITENVDKYKIYDTELINVGMPAFRCKENAQEVIDNPNFRDILDTIFK